MRDLGLVTLAEPFSRLLTQGMVLNQIYYRQPAAGGACTSIRPRSRWCTTRAASAQPRAPRTGSRSSTAGSARCRSRRTTASIRKTLAEKYGADTARLFMLFASPPEQTLEWSDEGVQGQYRFLRRLWKAVHDHVAVRPDAVPARSARAGCAGPARPAPPGAADAGASSDDIGRRRVFNTAIAAVMELLNAVARYDGPGAAARAVRQEALEIAVICLSPMVPHVCHELWFALGHERALSTSPGASPTRRRWCRTTWSWWCRSTASCAAACGGRRRRRGAARGRARRGGGAPPRGARAADGDHRARQARQRGGLMQSATQATLLTGVGFLGALSACGFHLQGRQSLPRRFPRAHRRRRSPVRFLRGPAHDARHLRARIVEPTAADTTDPRDQEGAVPSGC